jgi:hypothetical protein
MNLFAIYAKACLLVLLAIGAVNANPYEQHAMINEEPSNKAFNHLKKAIELANAIPSKDDRIAVCNQLEAYKNQFLDAHSNLSETMEALNENIDEILSGCGNEVLRVGILQHINAMTAEIDAEQE